MANVLGTLFSDIATAIRSKTGDTATMKPAEFPDKIHAIEVGGGSGDSSVELYTGTFTATGTWNETVSVNFGFMPDFLLVYFADKYTQQTSSINVWFYEVSKKFTEVLGKGVYDYAWTRTADYDTKGIDTRTIYYLETTDANTAFNNTSATGFTFGRQHPAGKYQVVALKLF